MKKKRDARWRVPECSQPSRLQLSVGVRTDFAIQVDLFVLRRRPFHGQVPPGVSMHWTGKRITRGWGEGNRKVFRTGRGRRKHGEYLPLTVVVSTSYFHHLR